MKIAIVPDEYNLDWFFDYSSGHTTFSKDALNASRMNAKPRGKQPVMCDTVYNGDPQKLVLPNGILKGVKSVFQGQGIDVGKMKADDMRATLQKCKILSMKIKIRRFTVSL